MRIRTRSDSGSSALAGISGTEYYSSGTYPNNEQAERSWGPYSVKSSTPWSLEERCEDVVSHKWREAISNGKILNNNFYHYKSYCVPPQPTPVYRSTLGYYGHDFPVGVVYSGTLLPESKHLGTYLDWQDDAEWKERSAQSREKALNAAFAKASSTEWATNMVLAEANKTFASILSILYRALRLFRAVIRLNFRYLREEITLDNLSDRYLEIRYALRPLLYDVRDAENAFNAKFEKPFRRTFRGSDSFEDRFHDTIVTNPSSSYELDVERTMEIHTSSRAGVMCDVTVSKISIFGTDQILETAWELVPFSFIVNWFIDVGSKIAAWTPNAGIRPLAHWSTSRTQGVRCNKFDAPRVTDPNMDFDSTFNWTGEMHETWTSIKRDVELPLDVLPSLNINLDTFKIIDLVLILRKLLPKIARL